jgi:hypothetical protein
MKKVLPVFMLMLFISCGSRTENTSTADTMNGVDTRPRDDNNDSAITHPDGYAPPNTSIDTSQKTKDSINASQH